MNRVYAMCVAVVMLAAVVGINDVSLLPAFFIISLGVCLACGSACLGSRFNRRYFSRTSFWGRARSQKLSCKTTPATHLHGATKV